MILELSRNPPLVDFLCRDGWISDLKPLLFNPVTIWDGKNTAMTIEMMGYSPSTDARFVLQTVVSEYQNIYHRY